MPHSISTNLTDALFSELFGLSATPSSSSSGGLPENVVAFNAAVSSGLGSVENPGFIPTWTKNSEYHGVYRGRQSHRTSFAADNSTNTMTNVTDFSIDTRTNITQKTRHRSLIKTSFAKDTTEKMGELIGATIAGKAAEMVWPNQSGANFAASWDTMFEPTTIRISEPNTMDMHHNREDGTGWTVVNPDAELLTNTAVDFPTPIRIAVSAEAPYQPQDLPLVAIKMFQPKSGKPTAALKITSPDVHTFIVPETTFL